DYLYVRYSCLSEMTLTRDADANQVNNGAIKCTLIVMYGVMDDTSFWGFYYSYWCIRGDCGGGGVVFATNLKEALVLFIGDTLLKFW
ncbi:hypothetical protein HAX54_039724, partial [Datura stramonium]|nr:hypothetical protein [Datura stramonium]